MSDKLAIDGGTPTRTTPFPAWPIYDEREERNLLEVLRSGQWGIGGAKVAQFEQRFAEFQGARFGVCVPNGTLALQMALNALGIGPGDEVITTPYTFIATASAAIQQGAVPVFVDIDLDTYDIDPAPSRRPSPRAPKPSSPCTWRAAPPTWTRSWMSPGGTSCACSKMPARRGAPSGAAARWAPSATWAPSASNPARTSPRAKEASSSRTMRRWARCAGRCTTWAASGRARGISTRSSAATCA